MKTDYLKWGKENSDLSFCCGKSNTIASKWQISIDICTFDGSNGTQCDGEAK